MSGSPDALAASGHLVHQLVSASTHSRQILFVATICTPFNGIVDKWASANEVALCRSANTRNKSGKCNARTQLFITRLLFETRTFLWPSNCSSTCLDDKLCKAYCI